MSSRNFREMLECVDVPDTEVNRLVERVLDSGPAA
jgi:hypothetical protein